LDASDGEAASDLPFIDPANFDDQQPFPLLVLRDRVDQPWPTAMGGGPELSTALDNPEAFELAYKQRITAGNLANPNFLPDPCDVSAAAPTATVAASLKLRFAGNMNIGDQRKAETKALIVAAFERALTKPAGTQSVTLFVHGTGNTLPDVIDHGYHLRALFGTEPIAFAWPSGSGRGGLAAYIGGVAAIKLSVKCFLPMQGVLNILNEVSGYARYQGVAKVLLFRSTGTRIFQSTLENIGAGAVDRQRYFSHVTRIVLSSPMAKSSEMARLTQHGNLPPIYVTINPSDQTLNFADKIDGWGKMLGLDMPDAGDLAPGVTYLNFTNAGRLHDYLFPALSQPQMSMNQAFFKPSLLQPLAIAGVSASPGLGAPVFDVS
jgi:hypothetical protein